MANVRPQVVSEFDNDYYVVNPDVWGLLTRRAGRLAVFRSVSFHRGASKTNGVLLSSREKHIERLLKIFMPFVIFVT